MAYENKIKNELYTECSSIINTVETKILFDFEGRNEKETREKFIDRQIGKDAPEDHESKNTLELKGIMQNIKEFHFIQNFYHDKDAKINYWNNHL
jgi:hypothetical protein